MAEALFWGLVAASSLFIGAMLGLVRRWPDAALGLVLAFGAGALISAISFDLSQQGVRIRGGRAVAFGLAAGAITFVALDAVLLRRLGQSSTTTNRASENTGASLALGALLDGIPEQFVLGTGFAVSAFLATIS
jgi:ZIP family zinc transporter